MKYFKRIDDAIATKPFVDEIAQVNDAWQSRLGVRTRSPFSARPLQFQCAGCGNR